MSDAIKTLPLLFAALLAGCATNPRWNKQKPPDWEANPPAPQKPAATAPVPQPAPTAMALKPLGQPTWMPLDVWSREHSCTPQQLSAQPRLAYAVTTSNGVLVVEIGSRTAYWNGVEVLLGFAPALDRGRVYLHRLDILKNLEPLAATLPELNPTNGLIVIDPGHGGGNTGTRSVLDGRFEKEFTLDLALRLAPLLERNGWRVLLTRTNDVDLPLLDRVVLAEAHKADLFISLHFNSGAPNEDPAGVETFCLTPTGMPSNLVREYPDDLSEMYPNNAFDAQNLQLALRLHRALLDVNGHIDRGIGRARFLGVLRGQRRPAVLLEAGFLSNPADARRIHDPAYRQKMAEAIAGALGVGTAAEQPTAE